MGFALAVILAGCSHSEPSEKPFLESVRAGDSDTTRNNPELRKLRAGEITAVDGKKLRIRLVRGFDLRQGSAMSVYRDGSRVGVLLITSIDGTNAEGYVTVQEPNLHIAAGDGVYDL